MPTFDPGLLTDVEPARFAGTVYRYQAPGLDPTSGEGARHHGGRFNPPHSFPVIYLGVTPLCVVVDLIQDATRRGLDVDDLLPRDLWAVDVDLDAVLDLSDREVRRQLHVEIADLIRSDHVLTRAIGVAARERRLQAIRSPAATGSDEIIAVFPDNLGAATVSPRLERRWTTPTDLRTE